MLRYTLTLLLLTATLCLHAQRERFNPEQFEARLTQHVVEAANFTQQEAVLYTAIHREMHGKQLVLFKRIRQYYHSNETDPKRCKHIVQEVDKLELQLKQLQQTYHNKLLSRLPADKVYLALKAEAQFHRKSFKKAAARR